MNPLRPFTTAWGSFSSFPFFEKSEPLSFIIFRRVRYLNNRPNRSLFFFVRALLKVGQNQAQCQAPIDTTLTLCVTGWSLTIQKKKQHFLDVCVTSWPFGLVNADALLPNVFQSDSFLVFKWGAEKDGGKWSNGRDRMPTQGHHPIPTASIRVRCGWCGQRHTNYKFLSVSN